MQLGLFGHPRAYRVSKRTKTLLRYAMRRPHEADFACFAHYVDRKGLFLDIGANSGVSALSFRLFHRDSPILSIEPNRFHEPDLKLLKTILRRFDYMICAAGDENATGMLRVPSYRGIPLTGEATLVDGDLTDNWSLAQIDATPAPGEFEIAEIAVEIRCLDELRLAPDFVKIDVEGFEFNVLRGLRQTLCDHEPILLIEAPENLADIKDYLRDLGYEPYVYDRTTDRLTRHVAQRAQNLFFLAGDGVPAALPAAGP